MKPFGLRVDVCHLTALSDGVPPILELFERLGVRATFFVALGPDNAGRGGMRRIFQPGFLRKMWKTRAWKMYGWKTITSGWFGPPKLISAAGAPALRALRSSSQEVGLHGWDHAAWQDDIEKWTAAELFEQTSNSALTFEQLFGRKPISTAAPGWRMTPRLLRMHDAYGFEYASDCRGVSPFLPVVDGRTFRTIQVPLTLPTLDEWLAMGQPVSSFFPEIIRRISSLPFSVLAVHPEAEGRLYLREFSDFLKRAQAEGLSPAPLSEMARSSGKIEEGRVEMGTVPGRAQRILVQRKLP